MPEAQKDEAEKPKLPTGKSRGIKDLHQEFESRMVWNENTSDEIKTLVMANLNGFVKFVLMNEYAASITSVHDQYAMAALTGLIAQEGCGVASADDDMETIFAYADAAMKKRSE